MDAFYTVLGTIEEVLKAFKDFFTRITEMFKA